MSPYRHLSLAGESLKKARHIVGICASFDDATCLANGPRLKVAIQHLQEANRLLNLVHDAITQESN